MTIEIGDISEIYPFRYIRYLLRFDNNRKFIFALAITNTPNSLTGPISNPPVPGPSPASHLLNPKSLVLRCRLARLSSAYSFYHNYNRIFFNCMKL